MEMKTTERKLKRISLCWRIFFTLKMSLEPGRNSAIRTRFIHSCIHEWEENENYNPCSLCGVIASFKRYFTKLRLHYYKRCRIWRKRERPEEELKKCKVNKRCHFSWVPYIHGTETNSPFRSIRSKMYNGQEDEAGSSPKCY